MDIERIKRCHSGMVTTDRVLRNSRIPLFLHRKRNSCLYDAAAFSIAHNKTGHEGKSYRMFIEWLVEGHYLRLFLGLSQIPHFTTLQKFAGRISNTLLEKIISSFIVISVTKHIFAGIDSTGFKITPASQYYTERTGLRRKYAKLSIGADVLQQIKASIKNKTTPTRHDNMDFRPIITRIAEILPLSVITVDKGYDSEDNHFLIRDGLHALSIIPARCHMNMYLYGEHMVCIGSR